MSKFVGCQLPVPKLLFVGYVVLVIGWENGYPFCIPCEVGVLWVDGPRSVRTPQVDMPLCGRERGTPPCRVTSRK